VKDISNETVLITGGGYGLGRLLAERFAKLGAKVIIWDINEENMKTTCSIVRRAGGLCHYFNCDVSDAKTVYATANKVRKDIGHVSMIVMNAGIVNGKKLLDTSDDQIRKCFDVNVLSHFWIVKAFLPFMMKFKRGHIISIDSVTAYYGTNRLVDYSASKAASHKLQDALYNELKYSGYDGIHITSILPYFISTGMFSGCCSKMISIMEPDYVADECIDAILLNKSVVLLPRIFHFLRWGTMMIPYKAYFAFHETFFGGDMMTKYKGRPNTGTELERNRPNNNLIDARAELSQCL
jgi:all-trans-retinol dehydrogenase (NAD+)